MLGKQATCHTPFESIRAGRLVDSSIRFSAHQWEHRNSTWKTRITRHLVPGVASQTSWACHSIWWACNTYSKSLCIKCFGNIGSYSYKWDDFLMSAYVLVLRAVYLRIESSQDMIRRTDRSCEHAKPNLWFIACHEVLYLSCHVLLRVSGLQ